MLLLILLAIISAALHEFSHSRETLIASGRELRTTDGDSFEIGAKRLRLDGIDAPEYRQTCKDAKGSDWDCGKAARASLEKLLHQTGLRCDYTASDQYGRALALCRTDATPDIAAQLVADGQAVSHAYFGIRAYGDEEDAARDVRKGIWQGQFIHPEDWRAARQ